MSRLDQGLGVWVKRWAFKEFVVGDLNGPSRMNQDVIINDSENLVEIGVVLPSIV